jgi:hypothetical protein
LHQRRTFFGWLSSALGLYPGTFNLRVVFAALMLVILLACLGQTVVSTALLTTVFSYGFNSRQLARILGVVTHNWDIIPRIGIRVNLTLKGCGRH